ncbi:MAG: alanyl-tRNA editing protein [Thermoplasmata archaeon]
MTELAYLPTIDAAYVREFRATVVARPPEGWILDRTFFYPAGGGQASDRGWIETEDGATAVVVEVRRRGEEAVHRLRGPAGIPPIPAGAAVRGRIDWDRRHGHMRLHTAQHALSALAFHRFGPRTRHARMEGTAALLELDTALPPSAGPWLTEAMAALARERRPVRIDFVPRAEWLADPNPRSGLVPLPERVDPVRIVTIEGVDRCPCGGTHIRSTQEIGPVRVRCEGDGRRLRLDLSGPAPPVPTPIG